MRLSSLLLAAASCVLAGSAFAQSTTKVIFLGHGGVNFTADVAILKFLETRYGKANVTFQTTEPAGTVKASTIEGYDVAVLSSTPSSGRYRNILHNSTTPIVNMEEAVADNTPAGEFSITAGRTKETEIGAHAITIKAAHAITKGFTVNQKVTLTTQAAEVWWSTGQQATGATSLATDDDTSTNLFITIVDQGGNLLNNTKAPCRRVMFGMTDHSFNFFTADAKKLFGQAIDWAACGCCSQSSSYGTGLAGKNGVPTLKTSAPPKFGSSVNILASNSSGVATTGFFLAGPQAIDVPFLGGKILVNPTFQAFLPIPAVGVSFSVTIPNLSALCGVSKSSLKIRAQMMQLDTSAVAGVSMTRGMMLRMGK